MMSCVCVVQNNSVTIGKMDIVWRSRFGEKGRIQTGQLKSNVRMHDCVFCGTTGLSDIAELYQVCARCVHV